MAEILKDLQPKDVFKYFEIISSIPRGSGNEQAISNYMVQFAKQLGLWVKQDEANNIYIKKPASPGYEDAPTVILQGHMDMVCEKNKDTAHDFEKEGLRLVLDGDYIKAQGTTLGADDGIAIAYQMAVLADKTLKHPAIEVLMTTDEERGMTGASHVHPEYLSGKILINLDTDVEGEFLVSCAGGVKTSVDFALTYEPEVSELKFHRIIVGGLLGGHSGADIHFERANAHIVMGRVLSMLLKKAPFHICSLIGGSKDNVITRECECIIACSQHASDQKDEAFLKNFVQEMNGLFAHEYSVQDSQIQISISPADKQEKVLSEELTKRIIDFLLVIPNGIISYDQTMKGLVETSLNLGILQMNSDKIRFGSAVRSSVPSKKQALVDKLEVLSRRLGGEFQAAGDYPAWEYSQYSKLREHAIDVFKTMYGKAPEIKSIHAGLECGFLSQKLCGIDIIAFGPEVKDIHSPNERVNISSMARVYEYLIKLLEKIDTY